MKVFREYRQEQNFLLPPSLDEFVPANHEVRIISDLVDQLDLTSLRDKYLGGGAPAYDPAMMLKIIIYAYSLGIYSSRKMVRELKTDTAFMYLSAIQCPDFRTLCLFRSGNSDVLPEIFVEVVRLCASLGMVKLGHIAIDGTKLRANASIRRTLRKDQLAEEIERIKAEVKGMIDRSTEIDKEEDIQYQDKDGSEMPEGLQDRRRRLEKLKEAREFLDKEKLKEVNVTDPEARLMQNKDHLIRPAYNVQVAVDDQDQIIVAAGISDNAADYTEFKAMLEQTRENLGFVPRQASADAGYFSYDNLQYAAVNGVDAYIPDNMLGWLDSKSQDEKHYDKNNLRYDSNQDRYICPEGKPLRVHSRRRRKDNKPASLYIGQSCNNCQVKKNCTHAAFRTIWRDERENLLYQMRDKLRSPEGRQAYLKRMFTVEPVFGDIKWNQRKHMLNLRGKVKARGEWSLICLVHNIRKIVKRLRQGLAKLPDMGTFKSSATRLCAS